MKKFLSILLTMILCLTLTAPIMSYAATVKLSKSSLTMRTGDTYNLKLAGSSGSIKWTSSEESIATVSNSGKVKAIKEGKATITAIKNEKKYNCKITVKSNKTVDIIDTAFLFDGSSIKEYAKQYKKDNPDCLDTKVYDDKHIVVTMYESDRLDYLKELYDNFDDNMNSLITDKSFDGVFASIETDKLLKNVKLYTDKDKLEKSDSAALLAAFTFELISDTVQTMNLIKPEDRVCNLTIIDNATGDVLYPTE